MLNSATTRLTSTILGNLVLGPLVNKAIKLTLTKPETRRGRSAVAKLILSLDDLLNMYDVYPVVWTTDEVEDQMTFVAHIPPDCMPEFDLVADCLASRFSKFREQSID